MDDLLPFGRVVRFTYWIFVSEATSPAGNSSAILRQSSPNLRRASNVVLSKSDLDESALIKRNAELLESAESGCGGEQGRGRGLKQTAWSDGSASEP